jgi:large subunit ribosomal protein L2
MGKRIIVQARGHGSKTYRVRNKAFKFRLKYPSKLEGEGTVIKLFNSPAHSAPLAKIEYSQGIFFIPAFRGMSEGQKVSFNGKVENGSIVALKDVPTKSPVYNIEAAPGDGGVFIKAGGSSAHISKVIGEEIYVLMPSRKEKKFNKNCRAIIGIIAGAGRLDKPIIKAGKQHFMKKAKNKLWPRTSAVKMNVIDHPFGSGRGKRIKSKIAKRNSPPGAKVGLVRPRRTGKRK